MIEFLALLKSGEVNGTRVRLDRVQVRHISIPALQSGQGLSIQCLVVALVAVVVVVVVDI